MRLTPYNVQSVLGVCPERLFDVLPEVFSQLLEPDQDDIVLQNYTVYKFFIEHVFSFHFISLYRVLSADVLKNQVLGQTAKSNLTHLARQRSNQGLLKQ